MVENNYLCWQVTCKSIYMRVSLLLFCIFSLFSSLSRGSSIPFSPIVRSYSVSDYNAGIQNWSIAQDDRGVKLTITDLVKFFDPETIESGSFAHGYAYPLSRTYAFGLNITF